MRAPRQSWGALDEQKLRTAINSHHRHGAPGPSLRRIERMMTVVNLAAVLPAYPQIYLLDLRHASVAQESGLISVRDRSATIPKLSLAEHYGRACTYNPRRESSDSRKHLVGCLFSAASRGVNYSGDCQELTARRVTIDTTHVVPNVGAEFNAPALRSASHNSS